MCDRWLSNGGEQDVCGAEPALRWSAHLLSLTVPLFARSGQRGEEWTSAVRQRVWRAVYCNTRGFLLDFLLQRENLILKPGLPNLNPKTQ